MKQRINFDKICKMYMACSNNELRPQMQFIYFTNGFAYASDGHILVKNKLSEINNYIPNEQLAILEGKLIHKSSFQKILSYDKIEITETGVVCKTEYSSVEFKFGDADLKYPNAELIFDGAKKNRGSQSKVSVNPTLLYRLSQALYSDGKLVMKFSENGMQAILIQSGESGIESEGVIMPIMIN